ncbi:MAG: flagellar protein FlgN [Ewingella sp.]|uniref:flagellar protein FlgN n=1 Tax=Ewingella TaxID=41201 RepID=UPI0033655411
MSKATQIKRILLGIREDNRHYELLCTLLELQSSSMIRRNSQELNDINGQILSLHRLISFNASERRTLLEELGLPANNKAILYLISKLPATEKSRVTQWWQRLESQVRVCKKRNARNGVLLNMQQNILQKLLGTPDDFLYHDAQTAR